MSKRRFPRLTRLLLSAIPRLDRYRRPRLPFPKRDAQRPASLPFISGDTFRRHCEHIFDETDVPFDAAAIRRGDRVFVNGALLGPFFRHAFPRITQAFVLVSHNSDHCVPGPYAEYLEHPRLLAWFTQNQDRIHPRLQPLPIGLANAHWPHGDIRKIEPLVASEFGRDRHPELLAYANFSQRRKHGARPEVWKAFADSSFCYQAEKLPYGEYLQDMQRFRFVISPPGNGPDCHRHWEALLMGCVPVMKRSPLDPLFADLPVVLVEKWSEVTSDFLQAQDLALRELAPNRDKLYAHYWLDQLDAARISTGQPWAEHGAA